MPTPSLREEAAVSPTAEPLAPDPETLRRGVEHALNRLHKSVSILADDIERDGVRYAHLYASGGTGDKDDPWTGWEDVFDNNPRHVHLKAGYYIWSTQKTVTNGTDADRHTRFKLTADGSATHITVRTVKALTIGPTVEGNQAQNDWELYGLYFFLDQNLGYTNGIFRFFNTIHGRIENVWLNGGPTHGGGNQNLYSAYLFEFDGAYSMHMSDCGSRGRYTYVFEVDDLNHQPEMDTFHFDTLFVHGPLAGIIRQVNSGSHGYTFTNLKYQSVISLAADVNAADETTLTAAAAVNDTVLTVAATTDFDVNDPVLIDFGAVAELNKVTAKTATTLTLAYPLRFAHSSGRPVTHGSFGVAVGANALNLTFTNPMFEQCFAALYLDGGQNIILDNVLSSARELIRIPATSVNIQQIRVDGAIMTTTLSAPLTLYGVHILTGAGGAATIRMNEIRGMRKGLSVDPAIVLTEWQEDDGVVRERHLGRISAGRLIEERHYASGTTVVVDKITTNGVDQHSWTGDGDYTAAGFVKANRFRLPASTTLTIAAGVITITQSRHQVDTEGAAATDDLDTINGGSNGDILVLQAANSTRDVVVKDGTGNIRCAGDFTMDHVQDTITLFFDGTNWIELSRSDNAT